jgi:hypothetical protein
MQAKNKLIYDNWPFIVSSIIAFVYFAFSTNIPFFFDMSYISSVAHQIYESNFYQIIDSANDNGTPPLYSLFLSLVWKLFGRNLFVSHLFTLPFFIGLLYQFYKLSARYLSQSYTFVALIILLFDPIFSTQFLLMGYDIILVFLFLLSVNSILDKKYKLLIISTSFIPLINIRGFSILLSIFLIHSVLNKNKNITSLLKSTTYYIPTFVITTLWYIYHYSKTGWFVVSSQNTNLHHINSLMWIIKNFIFELFAFISNGRFIFLLTLTVILLLKPKSFFKNKSSELVLLLLLGIAPFILIFTPLQYPTGPRYFMISYPFLYILFVYHMQSTKKITKRIVISASIIVLISSNFWVNPYPYSNSWDSSLKSLSYLKIQKKMLLDITSQHINGEEIISSFPLHKNMKYNYLDNSFDIKFSESKINESRIGTYIIYSNIYNYLELRKVKPSNNSLKLYKEYRCYPAWIKIYRKE